MMYEELANKKTDIENHKKETSLMNDEDARIIWLQDFKHYVQRNFPKLHFERLILPTRKKMLFHEQILFFLVFVLFFGIAFIIRKSRIKIN